MLHLLPLFAIGGAAAMFLGDKRGGAKAGASNVPPMARLPKFVEPIYLTPDHIEPETKVTRPSCTECVDKHLGAACVLMGEHRDGYPHRLRAIGHLHEAEDESQEWPALHEAVRAARKAFQQQGEVPDFELLARMVDAIRAGR